MQKRGSFQCGSIWYKIIKTEIRGKKNYGGFMAVGNIDWVIGLSILGSQVGDL